jgi:hypothetical protein
MNAPVFPVDCIAYCDESKYVGTFRFRAVSCVSVSSAAHAEIDADFRAMLEAEEKTDFGFEDLRTARNCIIAARLMRRVVEYAARGTLQIRTILWDAYDRRHGPGTDELRNLERMYVHLLRDVLARRWTARSWEIRPDQQTAIRWTQLARITEAAARKTSGRDIEVRHLAEQSSKREPLVQIADLYAGLMSHYAFYGAQLSRLRALPDEQRNRVMEQRVEPLDSASSRERFKLLPHILALHEENGIAAQFTNKGFVFGTSVRSPVYNWLYEPQVDADKAPRRADDEQTASFFYECSETDCADIVELPFESDDPYCRRHFFERNREKIEQKKEREARREAETIYREGSHYCDACGKRSTPSSEDIAKARYINRNPQCPVCKRWSLMSLMPEANEPISHDDRLSEFERKHDDRWDRH